MSGTSIFITIHWVGVGFIFLWFLGSSMKEGMWNNAITCFNALVAATLTLPLGIAVSALLVWVAGMAGLKPEPGEPYLLIGITMAAMWLTYIVCFLALATLTDYLSQVRVTFHPVVNSVGSFVFICGTTFVLFLFANFGRLAVQAGS